MKIETKFNLGDKVFVLCNNKVQKVEVVSLCAFTEISDIKINYDVRFWTGDVETLSEYRLFETKQELINSL